MRRESSGLPLSGVVGVDTPLPRSEGNRTRRPGTVKPGVSPRSGSVIRLALAVGFGITDGMNWGSQSAFDGKYQWFGVLVGVEGLAAGLGCALLAQRGRERWMAWWVGLVVAAHFVPLAFLLSDLSIGVVGVLQVVVLVVLLPRLRRADTPTSATVGPVMGYSLPAYALATAGVVVL